MVERGAAGNDASDGDEADGGLEADDSTPGGGTADAAAGVGAEGSVDEVCGGGCGGAGGRSAGDAIERPGIAGGAEVGDVAGAAEGELVEVELAEDDGAALFEADDDVCVFGGDAVFEHGAGGGGASACGVDVVFEADGDSVEWAAEFAGLLLFVEDGGLGEGLFGHDGDVAVHLGVVDIDAVEESLDELRGGHGAGVDHLGDFGETERGELVA